MDNIRSVNAAVEIFCGRKGTYVNPKHVHHVEVIHTKVLSNGTMIPPRIVLFYPNRRVWIDGHVTSTDVKAYEVAELIQLGGV